MQRATILLVLLGLFVAHQDAWTQGGSLSVKPTSLPLAPNARSGSIQLTNDGPGELRFQVAIQHWGTTPTGDMQLSPTEDLLVFPSVLALRAGETRSIRVGALVSAGPTERSYRVLISELDSGAATPRSGVQMLRRLNLPVFLQPSARAFKAELDGIAIIRSGVLAAHVRNLGSVHFLVEDIQIEGRGSQGQIVMTGTRTGWYVLPGADVPYEVPFDPVLCPDLAAVQVSIAFRDVPGMRLSETRRLAPDDCPGR